jgi:hypothetical protein
MPPYNEHLETSTKRTGKDYQAMHDWLDNHPHHFISLCPQRTGTENNL